MSYPLTVQSLIDENVNTLVDLAPDDPRLYQYLNSFQARALSYGRWWGTTQLMQFCATPSCEGACVVLPREVAVVEAIKVAGAPLNPRNAWYSFIGPHREWSGCCGQGPQSLYPYGCGCGCGCGPFVSEDKLQVPTFATTTTGQRIRIYFDSVDLGKKVRIQGYDENNVWVRTQIDGTWQDGEQVTLAATGGAYYTDTTTTWYAGSPTAVQKPITNKRITLYAADTPFAAGDVAQQLASYQPSETNPAYRKLYLPNVRSACGECSTVTVKCIVSLAQIPVSSPSDWLLFQNVAAYEDGVQAVRYWREGNRQAGDMAFFGTPMPPMNRRSVNATLRGSGALPTLQAELRKMTGDFTTIQVRRSGVLLPGFV